MRHFAKAGQDGHTAQRLLDAAAQEFALHGYAAARIRDIVDAAGVNLAAVNYHFGGKEGLYRATLAMLAQRSQEDLPGASTGWGDLAPEAQLHAFVRAMLVRLLGAAQASPAARLEARELLDPTPAFGTMLEELSGPPWTRLTEIVAALLGPQASREELALATFSIAGQWSPFLFGRRVLEDRFPDLARCPDLVDRLARHIVAFSLAALGSPKVPPMATGNVTSVTGHESAARAPRARRSVGRP